MFPSFPTYDAFLAAFAESLNSEFYCETYQKECEAMEDVEEKYIRHFLANGLDAQDGLVQMVDCFLENTRYAMEGDLIQMCIQPFLDAGASLTPLTSKIVACEEGDLEDTYMTIEVRGTIIDTFWRHLDEKYIQSFANWSTVKPKYWEYISADEEPFMAHCMYFKCCSDYLRGEHLRFAGCENEEGKRTLAKQEFMDAMMDNDEE